MLNDFESVCPLCHFPEIFRWWKDRCHIVTFQLEGNSPVWSHMCRAWRRPATCSFQKTCPSEPQSQLHFFFKKKKKERNLVFICLFCIHFQLMLQGKMLETKCLCLSAVEPGRDGDVFNALSIETFPLHCNCICLPTFTVDIHIGALPSLFISRCDAADLFSLLSKQERKHIICLAAQPVRLATSSPFLTRRIPGSIGPYPLRPGVSRAHLSTVALLPTPNSCAPCHSPYF